MGFCNNKLVAATLAVAVLDNNHSDETATARVAATEIT